MSFIATTTDDLRKIALEFLKKYPHPGIFLVNGEMGAGKTTFIHAVCDAMGYKFMGSPTFSIVNEYESIENHRVLHFDLYRLKSMEEAFDLGIEDYLNSEAYIFIEWPEIVAPLLPETAQSVGIIDYKGVREITF